MAGRPFGMMVGDCPTMIVQFPAGEGKGFLATNSHELFGL